MSGRLREPQDIGNLHGSGQWSSTSREHSTGKMLVRVLSAQKTENTICQIGESHLLQDTMNASDIGSGDGSSLAACLARRQ